MKWGCDASAKSNKPGQPAQGDLGNNLFAIGQFSMSQRNGLPYDMLNIYKQGQPSFPTMFSKALCFKVVKSRECVVKS